MKEIWSWVIGQYQVRLTGADPERTLRKLSEQIRLGQLVWESGLVVTFWIDRYHLGIIRSCAEQNGDKVEIVDHSGFPLLLRSCMEYPILSMVIAALLLATVVLPSRILFIQVEGNRQIPDALILERSAECGLYFGVRREMLRSEQVKNKLLSALPELSWVGVNTSGCTATISVQERQREPEQELETPGNIIARVDAIVLDVTATAGKAVCEPGDAVKKGQVLISGYTDMGLCTHVQTAEGEIYGLTLREKEAVLPKSTWTRSETDALKKKYSLIFGKKRINFYSDSGILHTGCGKMTQIRYLRLPGGWTLPVALIIDIYTPAELMGTDRWELTALDSLRSGCTSQLQQEMTAGTILKKSESSFEDGGLYYLRTRYECREMIGRRSSVLITEGDARNDGENGKRGAG